MTDFFSELWLGFLHVRIVDGVLPVIVYVLAGGGIVVTLLWGATRRSILIAALAGVGGGMLAVALWLVCVRWLDLFGGSLGMPTYLWLAAALSAVAVGTASLFRRGALRRTVAVVAIVSSIAAGTLGINAAFGLNRSIGNLLNIVVDQPLRLPAPTAAPERSPAPVRPLWETWTPPAGMPRAGHTGTVAIPNVESGFTARSAGVYLPPAALTANPPRLPVVLMLMGHPGNPDPAPIAQVLDAFAAANHGLAPIVVVADQVGADVKDTGCVDSRLGKVRTYLLHDVIPWMRANLNVAADPRLWTVAGYSNGGQCAISLGAEHPELFGTVICVSGEEFPGASHPADALQHLFGGDAQKYEQAKPLALLQQHRYSGTTAVFTAAKDDPRYLDVAKKFAVAAQAAGMNAQLRELAGGGHGAAALTGGLRAAFAVTYPVLELSPPGREATATGP
ncbi:alpha/beta hydrolase-fold protein [Microbacterium azadirachtae]|uniref:alpha/beta hydrolase n=1 Tax=Microbacterium azadirachtae TaxID=582680 RepID=UPI0021D48B06|nr:alpha/beta hydrolase-fold protein [Microbacterium azadirachtae]UXW85910.1 alpha/beta hydrolase-fold protein [Microbacterium azadirachtae]